MTKLIRNPLSTHILLIIILGLAFTLRLAYLEQVRLAEPSDTTLLCWGDAGMYDEQAQGALAGIWPGEQRFTQVPLYSFYLYGLYQLIGINYIAPLIIQTLFEVLACAALYSIGNLAYNRLTGLLSAGAMALYGPLILDGVCYAQVALTIPLFILSLFGLVRYCQRFQLSYLLVSGVLLGLAALSRPTMLIVPPLIVVWLWWQHQTWRHYFKDIIGLTIACCVTIAPVTWHNYQTTGELILISDQGGFNFYLGNNRFGSGIGPHDVATQYAERLAQFTFATEFLVVRDLVETGQTSYRDYTLTFITTEIDNWLELMAEKARLMLVEPNWKLIPIYAGNFALKDSLLLHLLPLEWATLILMSLLSLVVVRNRYSSLFGLITIVSSVVIISFFIKYRFRLPLTPLLFLLSMALISYTPDWFRQKRSQFNMILLLMLLMVPFSPSLSLFVLLYLLIGLYPYQQWPSYRWLLASVAGYLLIICLGLQLLATQQATAQTQNYYVGPQIFGPLLIGQSFVPECDGLYQIEVELSRVNQTQNQPYYFHLVQGTNLDDELFSTEFRVDDITRWTTKRFSFPAQPDSQGQPYLFYIHSPTSHPGNAITVRFNPDANYANSFGMYETGSVQVGTSEGLQPFTADLSFAASCDESLWELFMRSIAKS